MCVAQLKNADAHPEKPELMRSAITSSLIAVVDCQYSTGNRVKKQGVWIACLAVVLAIAIVFGTDAARQFVMFWKGQ